MDAVVEISGLRKQFGGIVAVDGVDLSVHRGEMFGLVGPDGAGKTTLLRMLCGILPPTAGEGKILGHDLMSEQRLARKDIGYLSQRFSLYGDLTIDENIQFFAEINGVKDFRGRRDELLEFTRLTGFRDRLAEHLSGGMKQKLALACTLIHAPEVIFLDEPTTGVDPVSRRDFWGILQRLQIAGITIVMSTPYLDEAERCSRVALMSGGRFLRVDIPSNLKQSMAGDVVEIVCDRIRHAFALLKEHPHAKEVQAFGDRVNVVVPNGATDVPALVGLLKGAAINVQNVRLVHPSLENVFISLLVHSESSEVAK